MKAVQIMTLGDVARRFPGMQTWQVRRLFERGLLPEPTTRAGGSRIIPVADFPKVKKALIKAGYMPGSRSKLQMAK